MPEGSREALKLLAERKIDADRLITSTFALDEIHRAFETAEKKEGIKVVVSF